MQVDDTVVLGKEDFLEMEKSESKSFPSKVMDKILSLSIELI